MRHRLVAVAMAALVVGACGGDDGDEVGSGGDVARATRTVEVRALDTRKFEPTEVKVKPGETVTIRVTNTATSLHEFYLGSEQQHEDHEEEMAAMGDAEMKMSDEPNRIFMEAGETKQITWTFPDGGSVIYGCHMPGHFAQGMRGTVTVEE
ncbi:MAG TPA: plastocyanin/azurin family copper-binding protein [Acidimicrobiales bacterium]|nr:plastocyanin/azurin family copper-binding protein [Acidimicrobiales bacterium]